MKIVIDGNIGSGKTTQISLLESDGFRVKREPIEEWPLELFYSDMERWGLTFQLVVLHTLRTNESNVIFERSPQSAKDIFWSSLKKTHLEDQVFNWAYEKDAWHPDVYIFLDKDPRMCYGHVQMRGQEGDSGVSLQYLQSLDAKYQTMFETMECPKYRVDATRPREQIHENVLSIVNEYVSTDEMYR
jgi:deoxyadenosine/deoxycytidine kinase